MQHGWQRLWGNSLWFAAAQELACWTILEWKTSGLQAFMAVKGEKSSGLQSYGAATQSIKAASLL